MGIQATQYESEFKEAIFRSQKEGYNVLSEIKNIDIHPEVYSNKMNNFIYELFRNQYAEEDGTFNLKKLKGTCLSCHPLMQKILDRDIDLRSMLTIGYLTCNGKDMFKFNSIGIENIQKINENNHVELNIHAWLTLSSYEIIDFTFIAQYEFVNSSETRKKELEKASSFIFNFGNADKLFQEENCIYHPLYVGKHVLKHNGLIQI